VPVENGVKMGQALPRAKFVEFEACGHIPHEEQPELVISAMKALGGGRKA
jgi:pimeloyl-ACP methyl ester carboxylesterase